MHGHLNVKGTTLVPKRLERIIRWREVIPQKNWILNHTNLRADILVFVITSS